MVIKKADHELTVSPDAYKSIYKRLGYEPVKKTKVVVSENKGKNENKGENKNENK